MKKIILIVIGISLFASCAGDAIDENLTGDLTVDGVFTTEEGINLALNGTYSAFTSFIGSSTSGNRETGWTLIAMGTDTYTNGADGNFKFFNTYNSDLAASTVIVQEPWDVFYRGINGANTVIGRAPEVITDPAKLQNILGQAHFLRGLYYYYLVRVWGAVHYTDQETVGAETEATRTPVPEIYTKIIEDMEFAAQNLPPSQGDFGRATSWAAKAALADIHLTRKNYDLAAQYSEDIINNGPFNLVRPVEDLWNLDNENNSEVILSAQFSDILEFDNGGNPAHMYFLMEYDNRPGMVRDVTNGRPWKRFKPTDYLINLYDLEDKRYDATFKTVWFSNNPNSAPPGMQPGDTAIWLPRVPLSQAEKDSRPHGVNIFNPDEYTERVYPATKKWIQPNRIAVNNESGSRDFIHWRLAEIYLIAAEANALKPAPDQNKALQFLNEVRMRAYDVNNVGALPPITSVTLDIILEERAKELAQEGKRWFDLVRTEKLVERVRLHNPQGAPNIQDFHMLRPIPLSQIDRTTSAFPQNPGY
ncbi:RagB/SusD family nutrient uptake outer membrane protein [Arenibacter sp. GZD96]|uniref:RagB/SusD family nutrient uptake outer membrane protein n=1 Tax=Aurantibrevibacter litoralis TaxID=3106030 RepID=UPI002AFE471B|nr:RagB/SusD family nutrient uptake outer membrane protein [Arenibacter sp. GZD-96]MEA1787094.1 RagB/SusD family nutrient uptake outer membrane protein [Arenibacter sp. GZD-96]